jgi:3-deoxy-manno-octulosonate cytidylyltransferase (CMP-KDO synthetase)
MRQVIVIPARMGGSRLPGKPLINILGKPMIQHVWERCIKVHPIDDVYIATENIEIEIFCKENGINCVNTGSADSAIDRIKLFSDTIIADTYINVQGDEPAINTNDIISILKYNKLNPNNVVFGKTKASESEFYDFSKAKVVCDLTGKLLYSSRSGIPINNKGKFVSAERAIWVYGFSKKNLDIYYNNNSNTKIDKIEDNEIIRFLEVGVPVYCIDLIGNSWAVDEMKDINIVENLLKNII